MKKIFTMFLALSLISLTHSCQDEELEVQTVSVNPVEQKIIEEETPFTLDQIDDPLLVNQYDNLNSLSKTILKEKLTTLYSDKVDLIDWDSVRLNTDYIYIEDQTTDSKTYRFLVDIPRVESDKDFIPPLVNVRVNHDIVNNDLLSDLHINDENISESLTFDLEGVVTNESSNDIVKQSARMTGGGSTCICWVIQDAKGVTSRINWVTSSSSLSIGGGGYSPNIAVAPAAVLLRYARQTGNAQILSAFGIVHIGGTVWRKEVNAKYINSSDAKRKLHNVNDLYIMDGYGRLISFESNYFYQFRVLKDLIPKFYNKKWNSLTNKYDNSTYLPYNQHVRRQSFIDSFYRWIFDLKRVNGSSYNYLLYSPKAVEKLFNLFADYHLSNRDRLLLVGDNDKDVNDPNVDQLFVEWLSNYILNNTNISLVKNYVDGKITKEQLYSKSIEYQFLDAVQKDPYLLIDTNLGYPHLFKWKTLAQHTAPKSVQDKIKNLPSGWANDFKIQDISNASGTVVNMDYFAVRVTQLPINPSTKRRFSADEFLQYFRKKINSFVDDGVFGASFSPYCKISTMCPTESRLWHSSNPLGTIVYIKIAPDDGVVALTKFTNTHWNFMTMNAPYAGNHPVSGTRQFGYERNTDGSYNFYVRGVDRIDSKFISSTLSYFTENPFFGADRLWQSFQNKMNSFIHRNGGMSYTLSPVKERPDWDKVKDVLLGKKPISDL